MATTRSIDPVTGLPSILRITSPTSSLASDAGAPGLIDSTVAPSRLAVARTLAPMTGYCALPVRRICAVVTRTCSIGIAKPTPMLPPWSEATCEPSEAMAELTPTTSPWRFTNGPPELPGLMAASVCTALM